jgi:biopolymer transport protein ExbD
MRYSTRKVGEHAEGDMTPMIDMTFQLIAFFMVLINFSDAEQNEKVELPTSELAIPPEATEEERITLHVTENGTVIFRGSEVAVDQARPLLDAEIRVSRRLKKDPAETSVIVRGHKNVKSGLVQELVGICQQAGYVKFNLRANTQARSTKQQE